MLPYATASDAEAALGRAMTRAEAAWFRYTAAKADYYLYYHTVAILLAVYTLLPLMLALLELGAPAVALRYKLQPRGARLSPSGFLRCYTDTARFLLPLAAPVQLMSYPAAKMLGVRMGLPLPCTEVKTLIMGRREYWLSSSEDNNSSTGVGCLHLRYADAR